MMPSHTMKMNRVEGIAYLELGPRSCHIGSKSGCRVCDITFSWEGLLPGQCRRRAFLEACGWLT